ncbi:hypothetical protein MKEN_01303100 [Mycena kentingensis (nom. inval.)]|nr:hypothetical protein MKEN_01303100 [Mycena kentingensis (nom. inval.)]
MSVSRAHIRRSARPNPHSPSTHHFYTHSPFFFTFTMSKFTLFTLASVFAAGLVAASPAPFNPSAGACNPSWGGTVTINAGSVEWGGSPVVAGTLLNKNGGNAYKMEQTGSYYPLYYLKAVENTGLAVSEINGELGLQQWDTKAFNQEFAIVCDSCPNGSVNGKVGSACSFRHDGKCVAVEKGGEHLQLTECADSVLQSFDIWQN